MSKNDFILHYPEFFVADFREETLWLQFSGNFFHNIQSFDKRDFFKEYLDELALETQIKTVVFHSAFSETGQDEYLKFFLFECPEEELGHFGFTNSMNRYDLLRFCNLIDWTILKIMAMNKMFIHICTGDVISLFMNISLACDYRIVTRDTVFHNIYQQIGMLPKGGAAYMLDRCIGPVRTAKLLHLPRVDASQALAADIVDEVVDKKELERRAMELALQFNDMPAETLFGLKRLRNHQMEDFKDYLAYETEQILKIRQKKGFAEG